MLLFAKILWVLFNEKSWDRSHAIFCWKSSLFKGHWRYSTVLNEWSWVFQQPMSPVCGCLPSKDSAVPSCKVSKRRLSPGCNQMCSHHTKWFAITLTNKDIIVPDKASQRWHHRDDVPGDSISAQWLLYFMPWEFRELLSLLLQGSNSWLESVSFENNFLVRIDISKAIISAYNNVQLIFIEVLHTAL